MIQATQLDGFAITQPSAASAIAPKIKVAYIIFFFVVLSPLLRGRGLFLSSLSVKALIRFSAFLVSLLHCRHAF
jgi:hypothetical protein